MHLYTVTRALVLFTYLCLVGSAHADCYWSDGTENDSHQPCYSSHGGAVGLCCANGDICMTGGICMQSSQSSGQGLSNGHSSAYYRGSCMFKDWSQGKDCPTVCLKGPGTSPHAAVAMIPCPDSDTDWYCADGNEKKANCSSGAYIVTLAKAKIFTTIGVSPSLSGPPRSTSPPTALGGGSGSTMTAPVVSATASSTAPSRSGGTGGNRSATSAASTTTDAAPSDRGSVAPSSPASSPASPPSSSSPSPLPPKESAPPDHSSKVPLAVGVSIGGASLIGAGVLGYFLWRRRQRDSSSSLARAETPPPRDTPDDDFMNPMITGPLFRAGSLARRPNSDYLNTIGRAGPTPPEALVTERALSMRSNSIRSSYNMPHHNRSVSQDRFGPDIVAMHDMRRTPPACWGYPRGRSEPTETIPEIPFDGRRLPPYHGTPVLENNGFYSELPA